MALKVGLVGLAKSGKTTLFNALTGAHAATSAYRYSVDEPNVGVVQVPDDRLAPLAAIFKPGRVVPATVEFVDVAGLAGPPGAGDGASAELGRRFLGHIREAEALALVLGAFPPPAGAPERASDPLGDLDLLLTELSLADLGTVERRLERTRGQAKNQPDLRAEVEALDGLRAHLQGGRPARTYAVVSDTVAVAIEGLFLLTSKPMLYVVNVGEAEVSAPTPPALAERAAGDGAVSMSVSARFEADLRELEPAEAAAFMADASLETPPSGLLVRRAYELLRLLTFFTGGEMEVKAWTTSEGATAPQAAGVIHTDFIKGFIRAEVVSCEALLDAGSMVVARERGKVRLEGKEYVMHDGDVVHFRVNV